MEKASVVLLECEEAFQTLAFNWHGYLSSIVFRAHCTIQAPGILRSALLQPCSSVLDVQLFEPSEAEGAFVLSFSFCQR